MSTKDDEKPLAEARKILEQPPIELTQQERDQGIIYDSEKETDEKILDTSGPTEDSPKSATRLSYSSGTHGRANSN